MPVSEINFVEAYRASHPLQAHALRIALEEAGIRVVIENEALQDAIGDLPGGWSSAPRLMVEESQLAAAREILSQTDHSETASVGLKPSETAIALTAAFFGIAGCALAPGSVAEQEQVESTRCLACDAIMADAESTCPKCGWSYSKTDGLEPADESLEDW